MMLWSAPHGRSDAAGEIGFPSARERSADLPDATGSGDGTLGD
jgi:hypothetical protein